MASPLFGSVLWITLTIIGVTTSDTNPRASALTLQFLEEPQDVIAVKNKPLWLPCSVNWSQEAGPVYFSWEQDGEVVNDQRRTILPNGTLYIEHFIHKVNRGRSYTGLYQCSVRNDHGTIVSRPAEVTVAVLQNGVTIEPSAVTAHQGELVRLLCQVQGNPFPTISWEINKKPLPQDARYVLLPTGVLQIINVSSSDAGEYHCHAVNIAKDRTSSGSQLIVISDGGTKEPTLLVGPENLSVVKGQSAILECGITGLPQPTITWTRQDDAPLPRTRHSILGLGNLKLTDVQLSDAGVYICSSGSVSSQATLNILVPPIATSEQAVFVKKTIEPVSLQCKFSGVPAPAVTWYKNGHVIVSDGRIKPEGNVSSYRLHNMDPGDSGFYQCVGHNDAGYSSRIMSLVFQATEKAPDPPYGLQAHQYNNGSIMLSWKAPTSAVGSPVVGYSVHYKSTPGGDELQLVTEETNLVIKDLEPHTNYSFYTMAYNMHGASIRSETVTRVTDEDYPKVAPETIVSPMSSNSLKVEWYPIPPDKACGEIVQYKLYYRLKGSSEEKSLEVEPDQHECFLENLEQDQTYEVRVLAATRKGYPTLKNENWPWHAQTTNINSNHGLPEMPKMVLSVINSTTINVTWEVPAVNGPDGADIIGYKIQFNKPSEAPKNLIVPHEVHERIIPKLEPDTLYHISLLAFTEIGDGPMAVKTTRTMPVFGQIATPVIVNTEPVNESAIKVSWSSVQPATALKAVINYTLRYVLNDPSVSGDTRELAINDSTTVVVGYLKPNAEYKFAVQSRTGSTISHFSEDAVCKTKEGRPSAPRYLQVEVPNPGSVRLQWLPPLYTNGIIRRYVIFYNDNSKIPTSEWHSVNENGSTTSVVLELSNNQYFFKVAAATNAGEGPPTEMIHVELDPRSGTRERNLGIIVGVSIGGGCIIICAVIILLRNRCFPPRQVPLEVNSGFHGNGCVPGSNGNAVRVVHVGAGARCSAQELDSIVPMLSNITENEHSDSKGGTYTFHNDKALNGMNGMLNGVQSLQYMTPNGRVKCYKLHSTRCHDGIDDGCQIPLRHCHGDCLNDQPITVHLSSLDNIDHSYMMETDNDAHMKASPSSSGVTDCTQGPIDHIGVDSNTSSQTASLERSGYSSARSTGSRKGTTGRNRGAKKVKSESSPHSTLSNSSSSVSTPTAAVIIIEGRESVLWPGALSSHFHTGWSQQHAVAQPVSHVDSEGHGPGRPSEGTQTACHCHMVTCCNNHPPAVAQHLPEAEPVAAQSAGQGQSPDSSNADSGCEMAALGQSQRLPDESTSLNVRRASLA